MSVSNSRKKKKRLKKPVLIGGIVLIVFIVAAVLYVTGVFAKLWPSSNQGNNASATGSEVNDPTDADEQNTIDPVSADALETGEAYIPLGSNINIVGIGSYMGDYVEDGSDEFVDGVMMITVENRGGQYLQLADIVINGTYQFELTTLFPGEKMIVLEKNKQAYDSSLTITSVDLGNVAIFQDHPSLQEDKLSFTTSDNKIVVTNISEENTPEGKIFYKNHLEDGTLLGGITYCGSIPSLDPGEEVTLSSAHYIVDESEITFVTFGE